MIIDLSLQQYVDWEVKSWLISILTPPLLRSMGRTGICLKIQFLVFHDFAIQCYNITITHIVIFVNTVFQDSRAGALS